MALRHILPPTGIEPSDQYSHELRACRTSDKKSIVIYPRLYRPQNDPYYEDPAESCMAWQNQEDGMDQLNWLKKIHEVIGASEPTSHPRVQRLMEFQPETGFPVVEFVERGDLYSFLRAYPQPTVPSGTGSENPSALKLRWALNIASALAFLHSKNIIFEGLSPNTVHLRADFSAALVNLDVAAYREQGGTDDIAIGYRGPDWDDCALAEQPETWITHRQDLYGFGSLLYYLLMEEDPNQWKDEEEMRDQLDEEDRMDEIIRKCWMREFGAMGEVVEALKGVIVRQGLEVCGDDVVVDDSVERFEAAGIFAKMIRETDGVSS
ncbi:kinase-like domain-containing protein [Leptodontidium sp. MPI-SDFR-AT-0119]|nr:kinase-like domain-containing protein [Leptodontidium sp. MPI-SDFR-AT-0119]